MVVAGCSSGSDGGSSGSDASSAASSASGSAAADSASGGGSAGGDLTTIRVASNSNTGALPLWVAMEKGIFAKHGLKVQYTEVQNVGTLPPALNKTFDIAFVTPAAAIEATAKGIPVAEVAGAYTDTVAQPDSFLMVKKGSDIKTLAQLKGKTIGALTIAGTLNYATLNMLKQAGVSPDSVKIINVNGPQQQAQLNAGRVDAVETLVPFSIQIKASGGTSLGIPFQSISKTISVIWWGANPTWASQHADVVQKFRDSLSEAIDFIKGNKSDAATIVQKYTKLSASLAGQSFDLDYDASVRPQDISKWVSILKEFAGFKGDVDPSKIVFKG